MEQEDAVDLRWAGGVLAGEQGPPPESLRPEVAQALVDELVDRTEADALTWLASAPGGSGKLAKLARTGVHRLRTRKVDVALSPVSTGSQGPGGGEHAAPRADVGASQSASLATIYDGRDERLVWLVEPGTTKGLMFAQGRMSARHGLLDCEIGSIGRKAYRGLVRDLKQRVTAVEVDGRTARWLLDDAARRAEAASRTLPRDYLHLRREFGPRVTGDHPALALEPADVEPAELPRLLEHRALAGWIPETSSLRSLQLRLQEVTTSQLMVNEEQRGQQVEHAVRRWLGEYLTAERVNAHRTILLDTAQLLTLGNDAPAAALARAAAEVYDQPVNKLRDHPLVRRFLERVLPDLRALVRQASEERPDKDDGPEKVTGGGLIIP